MREHIFLFRLKNSDNRDCCAYIDDQPRFECNHYFGGLILHGACYCQHEFPKYEEIETILTKDEYLALQGYNKAIGDLGYGIEQGDERYKKGYELYADVGHIFAKLKSLEGKAFQQKIIESEIEYIMNEYNLSRKDVDYIFDNYGLDYRDRGIIGCVFEDIEECGYEEAFNLGYINSHGPTDIVSQYFDYERFGQDLIEEEWYLLLEDGRVVYLNY